MKKRYFVALLWFISIPYTVFMTEGPLAVKAAAPMPTNINIMDALDEEVSAYYEGVNGKKVTIF